MEQQVIDSEVQPEGRLHEEYMEKTCSLLMVAVKYHTSFLPRNIYRRGLLELVTR